MSTPQPLHSSPSHGGGGGGGGGGAVSPAALSPVPPVPPLGLQLPLNVVSVSVREPPHYSALLGKTVNLDGRTSVTIEEVIAEGGFGVIFLGKEKQGRRVALKRVVVNSARDYESVLGEVGVMTLIAPKTPHLLRSLAHAVCPFPPATFEVQNLMPLCAGNLTQEAQARKGKGLQFEGAELLRIVEHVSSGLQFLHGATPPIIHRDVKIENVLLMEDNFVLSDFGSATTRVWDPAVDSVHEIQEDLDKYTTLQYRSPEMADLYGGRGAIAGASDVWAVGVSAFKLMSFKDPFETVLAIQNRNVNWSLVKGRYPDNLVLLVEVLLAEHQGVRPPVEEVIRLCAAARREDWSLVQAAYARVVEHDRKRNEETSVKNRTNNAAANVVMETTVTPRQRPKRGGAVQPPPTAATAPGGVIIPPVLAPPKSPKPVSPNPQTQVENNAKFFSPVSPAPPSPARNTSPPENWAPPPVTSTTTTTTSSGGGGSYNPFDDDYRPPPTATCDTTSPEAAPPPDDPEFDPFLNAPFDYFKYQPISVVGGVGEELEEPPPVYPREYYAPTNPFAYPPPDDDALLHSTTTITTTATFDLTNNNAALARATTGVCNLSFEENNSAAAVGAATLLRNNHSHASQQDS